MTVSRLSPVSTKAILGLALPALGTLAADPLLSLIDTAFVGRLGPTALAALGIDIALFGFAFVVFNFLAYATTPLVATARARGASAQVGLVISRAMTLAIVIGIAMAPVLAIAGRPLIVGFGAAPGVVPDALDYLRVRAIAVPALLVIMAGHGAFRGLQDTKTPLYITIAANVLNAVLDPVLMFGFGMGIAGAALATVVAQGVAAIAFVVLLRSRSRAEGFEFRLVGLSEASRMLTFGGVLMLRTVLLVATLAAATSTAARIGTEAVAAHQVVVQLWFLLAMMVDALAIAAQALIADLVGRNEAGGIRGAWRQLLVLGFWSGVFLAALLWVGGRTIAPLFTDDRSVLDAINQVLPIAALMQPVAAVLFVADGLYMGLLSLRRLALSTAVGLVAAASVFWWTLANDKGLVGVWWGIGAMVVARAVVLLTNPPVLPQASGAVSRAATG